MAGLKLLDSVVPDWSAPSHIRCLTTTRSGGYSIGAYSSLNLADHVGDESSSVAANRELLERELRLPAQPFWLNQVHGATVARADQAQGGVQADASWSVIPGTVCAVLTADCLPVLLCSRQGERIAAVHAGWQGLCAGVLQAAIREFLAAGTRAGDILAWLGPAISAVNYEVDDRVRQSFARCDVDYASAFVSTRPGHWQLDLYEAARQALRACGLAEISGGQYCTFADERFYSYRRTPVCGRQATLIWIENS